MSEDLTNQEVTVCLEGLGYLGIFGRFGVRRKLLSL
jgi:hypothetical protein